MNFSINSPGVDFCPGTVDTASLTNNPSFYFDPRMKDGVYTMDNISPENIEIIDFIKGED